MSKCELHSPLEAVRRSERADRILAFLGNVAAVARLAIRCAESLYSLLAFRGDVAAVASAVDAAQGLVEELEVADVA